jgi:hypothetical protein
VVDEAIADHIYEDEVVFEHGAVSDVSWVAMPIGA